MTIVRVCLVIAPSASRSYADKRIIFSKLHDQFSCEIPSNSVPGHLSKPHLLRLIDTVFGYVRRLVDETEWTELKAEAVRKHERDMEWNEIIARYYLEYAYSPERELVRRAAQRFTVTAAQMQNVTL
jgi:hypothetical protein